MDLLSRSEMTFGIGPAGTGKTYLAVAQAVAMLQSGRVDRIVLSRPAVEAGERLGFLPGDLKDKVDPYLRPLYDALGDMLSGDQVTRRMAAGEIEVAPLAFMRGRTLAHSFVILDEAQNTTPVQMKMFLTRMGEGHPHGDHRRPEPDRPAQRPAVRPARCAGHAGRRGRHRPSRGSIGVTWCATRWWRASWMPTSSATPRPAEARRERRAETAHDANG